MRQESDVLKAITEYVRHELLQRIMSGELNKMQAARLVVKKFPAMTLDNARKKVRYETGSNGDRYRKFVNVDYRLTIADGLARIKKQPHKESKSIRLTGCKALILSDIHFPHQNEEALALALGAGFEAECDTIILNGDILDFYKASRWAQTPGHMGIEEEIVCLLKFFDLLKQLFPTAPIYYVIGNHEVRLERYIIQNAEALYSLPELSFSSLIKADKYGVTLVQNEPIKLGKLNVMHGHEFGETIFSPVNPARGLFLRAKASTIIGHYHQPSEHTESNINGDQTACYSTGCLCDLNPDYRPFAFTKWMHGFAIVTVDESGAFTVNNHKIIKGAVR